MATCLICYDCNNSFAPDEEYFVAFLSCVLSGSTEPNAQKIKTAAKILSRSDKLRELIRNSRKEYTTLGGETGTIWRPISDRIGNVIVKNARAHWYYECGEPLYDIPSHVDFKPLTAMSPIEIEDFYRPLNSVQMWAEVGSRWNFRLLEGDAFDSHGFLIVQPDNYRFRIEVGAAIGVRSVIRNYLASTVIW